MKLIDFVKDNPKNYVAQIELKFPSDRNWSGWTAIELPAESKDLQARARKVRELFAKSVFEKARDTDLLVRAAIYPAQPFIPSPVLFEYPSDRMLAFAHSLPSFVNVENEMEMIVEVFQGISIALFNQHDYRLLHEDSEILNEARRSMARCRDDLMKLDQKARIDGKKKLEDAVKTWIEKYDSEDYIGELPIEKPAKPIKVGGSKK